MGGSPDLNMDALNRIEKIINEDPGRARQHLVSFPTHGLIVTTMCKPCRETVQIKNTFLIDDVNLSDGKIFHGYCAF
jgi:hypothetical protein